MTDLVTLTVDEVEVTVPKGTGLVEAALMAGIEIPVFCYEPRLGPPVGACRMCLCEVAPGPPKPQAACTLTAAEGMVVKTAATSEMAAESQNATLEFILVNHPLDCPVCDKGGECPLQDLTFRYGPGNTRMTFPKRTFEKPIPVSPLIALDDSCCMVQLGIRISEFYEHESCGKCTPCREGTRWMTQILRRLESGEAVQSELDLLLDVCDRINGKCLCPLGETAAVAVASYVEKFRAEFVAHVDQGGCPFGDSSPLHDVLAPVAVHSPATVPA